jgi:hypothetical protein
MGVDFPMVKKCIRRKEVLKANLEDDSFITLDQARTNDDYAIHCGLWFQGYKKCKQKHHCKFGHDYGDDITVEDDIPLECRYTAQEILDNILTDEMVRKILYPNIQTQW